MTHTLDRLGNARPLLLDGATGTELERRGVRCALPLWSAWALVHAPDRVREVHSDYAAAGCHLLTANTFRTQRRALAHGGLGERASELTATAVALARQAAESVPRPPKVLGSSPPLEDCFRPDLVPADGVLAEEHAAHAENLAAACVDATLVETMNCVREARAALRAASDAGLPALASFVCWQGAALISGEPLRAACDAACEEGALALLVNCLPPSNVPACLETLADSGLPFGVYPNLGAPLEPVDRTAPTDPKRSEDCTPHDFARLCGGWLQRGASLVGGCCGTSPSHLGAVAQSLRSS